MVGYPRLCSDCKKVYWPEHVLSSHGCEKSLRSSLNFDHFKEKKPKEKKPEKQKYDYKCKVCEAEFKSGQKNRLYCTEICRKKDYHQNKLNSANDKWIENKPRKKPKYSMRQLNEMAEWKRLYQDDSWMKSFKACRG